MGKVMKLSALIVMLAPLPSFAVDFDNGVEIGAEFAVSKDLRRLQRPAMSSHVDGRSVEEMLELVSRTCVIDACRADNVLRQMKVLALIPENSWILSADEIAEVLGNTDAGVYDHDANTEHRTWYGLPVAVSEGPHRFVLRSLPESAWKGFDRREVEKIVESLTRQDDRILAISLWIDARP